MTPERLYMELNKALPKEVLLLREPMKDHTTFAIGGPCDVMVCPRTEEEIRLAVAVCTRLGRPWVVLGNGSNVLVRDGGIRGCVILLNDGFSGVTSTGVDTIYAQAGCRNHRFASVCAQLALTGSEFISGIPGTIGGAVFMNAGAYGSETGDVVRFVRIMDRFGAVKQLSRDEMAFSYRHSFAAEQEMIILGAEFQLKREETAAVSSRIADLNGRRKARQPLEYPSAGSAFKRPQGHYAARLIDRAGLKGYRVGDAQVSEKHAGFIINRGNASASEVLELIRRVRNIVFGLFGVLLEPEIRILGDDA